MAKANASRAAIDAFKHNYEQLVGGATGLVRMCPCRVACCFGAVLLYRGKYYSFLFQFWWGVLDRSVLLMKTHAAPGIRD